ncbi:UNVERIFIED_CONTAM: Polyadenylate-binding protein-interacting protein 7 [Sesamum radiatum]|uniref:Polyadenylate-binding protein-interacting protein 7 n=1 Tax=Sesamum radiatum TaxID=300843 RepID=A0AAW2L0Q5_SESRA
MNLSGNGGDKKLIAAKATLNPNAAEFVPFALRSPASGISSSGASSKFATSAASTPGKAILDRSESSISNNSDDEAKQYWHHQLPDDITPDFKVMGISDTQGINYLPFSSISLTDVDEGSRYTYSEGSSFMLKEQQGLSLHPVNGSSFTEKLIYPVSSYGEYPSPTGLQPSLSKPWDKHILTNDQLLAREEHPYNGNSRHGFLADMSNEHILENADVSPLEFLASQFPGFAAESLSEVYFANGGDLNLTIEMLTQLELQVDGGLNQTLNSKALSTPNLSALDFPALTEKDGQNDLVKFAGADLYQNVGPYRSSGKESTLLFRSSSSIPARGATDFASAVKNWHLKILAYGSLTEMVLLKQALDQVEMHKSPEAHIITARPGAFMVIDCKIGDQLTHLLSGLKLEKQLARQAYLIGNKALAKELSIKGQLHNMQMKAAHGKAQESIYRQRNPDMLANGRERMIDLHGLHVSEAIHVLKRELMVLKSTPGLQTNACSSTYVLGLGTTRGVHALLQDFPLLFSDTSWRKRVSTTLSHNQGSFELSYTELGRQCHHPSHEVELQKTKADS